MFIVIKHNIPVAKLQLKQAEEAMKSATSRALHRMGLVVEAEAVKLVKVNSGHLRQSIHVGDIEFDHQMGVMRIAVIAESDYAVYVEFGFQGHFVPFNIAPSLYREALSRWGWRPPSPQETPKNAKPGRMWLVPRGRKHAVWGVKVSGKARPFLRPAIEFLENSGLRTQILQEEYSKALAQHAATVR